MADSSRLALEARFLAVAVTRLLPVLPLSLLLGLERWVTSNYAFSGWGLVAFRAAYVVSLFFVIYATYLLAAVLWN